jgi:hypothetical protein
MIISLGQVGCMQGRFTDLDTPENPEFLRQS